MYICLNQITIIYIMVTKDVGTIKFYLKLSKLLGGVFIKIFFFFK